MISTERIDFRRVRDFSEIFNATFAFTQQHFKPLGKAVLFIAGPVVLIEGVFAGLTQTERFLAPERFSEAAFWLQNLVFWLAVLFAAVMVLGVVCEYVVLDLKQPQKEITVEEVWQALRADFWMLFWTAVASVMLYMLGLVFCFVPGIYLAVVLSPMLILRLHERCGFGEAMTRCRHLITDYWWTGFGLVLVSTLIVYAVTFVFQLPQLILTFGASFHALPEMSEEIYRPIFMLTTVLASFAGIMSYAFPELVICFYYFNLVERKEARGLMDKIDQIAPGN